MDIEGGFSHAHSSQWMRHSNIHIDHRMPPMGEKYVDEQNRYYEITRYAK